MDIYQKIVAELSVEPLAFDENGVCTFEIQRAAEEATAPFVVNIVAQPNEMALVLSVTTASDLPERLSRELFLRFGEHALAPLRHGYGVGIYPGTERVSFFPDRARELSPATDRGEPRRSAGEGPRVGGQLVPG